MEVNTNFCSGVKLQITLPRKQFAGKYRACGTAFCDETILTFLTREGIKIRGYQLETYEIITYQGYQVSLSAKVQEIIDRYKKAVKIYKVRLQWKPKAIEPPNIHEVNYALAGPAYKFLSGRGNSMITNKLDSEEQEAQTLFSNGSRVTLKRYPERSETKVARMMPSISPELSVAKRCKIEQLIGRKNAQVDEN